MQFGLCARNKFGLAPLSGYRSPISPSWLGKGLYLLGVSRPVRGGLPGFGAWDARFRGPLRFGCGLGAVFDVVSVRCDAVLVWYNVGSFLRNIGFMLVHCWCGADLSSTQRPV